MEYNEWFVYLLENSFNKKTYLGITNNMERRIKQHNGLLKGGAKYTTANKQNGEWIIKAVINNLNKKIALSLERTIKNKRKHAKGKTPLEKRLFVINNVINEKNNILDLNLIIF